MPAEQTLARDAVTSPGTDGWDAATPGRAGRGMPGQRRSKTARLRVPARSDLLALGCYLLGSLWVAGHLWIDPRRRVLLDAASGAYQGDQFEFEYWLAHAAQMIIHGWNPLHDGQMNAPAGVNMMANTPILGLAVPLAPVTLLLGPSIAFVVLVTLAPLCTALAWYWLLSRHVVTSRVAAAVGGAICGFAPGIIAQTDGHPNIAAQFVIPFIVWQVVQLVRGERLLRHGPILGALVVYQVFVNEEVLFITAIALLVAGLTWVASRPARLRERARHIVAGLAVAGAVALTVLAFPLWYEFFGPQHYNGLGAIPRIYDTDLYSFVAYPTNSLVGNAFSAGLAAAQTEQDTFFGWGLPTLAFATTVVLWRNVVVRCAGVSAAVLGLLSLGTALRVGGENLSTWGPWRLLMHLPFCGSVICTRFGVAMIPPIALLMALVLDGFVAKNGLRGRRELRRVAYAALGAALLPLLPMPLPAIDRPSTPAFVTSGRWHEYVAPGQSLVVIPLTTAPLTMSWAAEQRVGFRMVSGFFLGPDPTSPDRSAMFGAPPRPTELLWEAAAASRVPVIRPVDQARAQQDLQFWRAGAVVLAPQPHAVVLRTITTQLLGFPPQWVGGVWVWDVA
jgi:hypothetical protein